MMSSERQAELVYLVKQGGTEGDAALADLINGIMPVMEGLAWNFANAHPGSVHDFDDLVQEQAIFLPAIMEGYDPGHESGASFSTYARTPFKNRLINLTRTPRPLDNALSLNEAILGNDGDGRGMSWVRDRVVGPKRSPEIAIEAADLMKDLGDALGSLPERERLVVELHNGIGNHRRHTFKEIDQVIDRTEARAGQIKREALSRLGKDLKDWL